MAAEPAGFGSDAVNHRVVVLSRACQLCGEPMWHIAPARPLDQRPPCSQCHGLIGMEQAAGLPPQAAREAVRAVKALEAMP